MYSIFHTSSCGSTLLTCLLSKSIASYSEPDWVNEVYWMENLDEKINRVKECHKQNTLVKYSSKLYEIAPYFDNKKVFIYRNFDDHLIKLNPDNKHDEAVLWNKRFEHLINSHNVLYIEYNYFIKNQQSTAQKVCNHFGIEYIPIEIDFHVKKAGYHHTNTPINI